MTQALIALLITVFLVFLNVPGGNCLLEPNEFNLTSSPVPNVPTEFTPKLILANKTGKNVHKPMNSASTRQRTTHNVSTIELARLSEDLFNNDVNNAWKYIKINLQNVTTSNSTIDRAPLPLLKVNPAAFRIPTIGRLMEMYDNYHLDTRKTEKITAAIEEEQQRLLDAFLETRVMTQAMDFLWDKNFLPRNQTYRETLKSLWFSFYSRGGGTSSSSGFEHVFLTELKRGKQIIGFHNWIYFNAMEGQNKVNYLGYFKQMNLGDKAAILAFPLTFNSHNKPRTSMFIGTSPELEMALYTVCFYVRRGKPCKLSRGGSKFRILTFELTYKGKTLPVIASAFPIV